MLRITELARRTGASTDEIRYLETKGLIKSKKAKIKKRMVRHFAEENVRIIELIIKYRRQGFTWKTANEKARQEIERPALF
jgi:DNA-binding transcriptional MerR regulator